MDADHPANVDKLAAARDLGEVAHDADLTPVQLATASVLTHPAVSADVVGPRTADQLDATWAPPVCD